VKGNRSRAGVRVAGAFLVSGLLVVACGGSAPATDQRAAAPASRSGAATPMPDRHSFARPDEVRVTHVALDLRADFTARRLAGTATLTLARQPGSAAVVLDTNKLAIDAITAPDGRPLAFTLGETDPILGRPLTVTLPDGVTSIAVRYRTDPAADALQWLAPSQTAGKRHPYLYSQGEAILTRSWIPTQDSPGIRQTYSARLVVPDGLRAVMSAEQLTPDGVATPEGRAFEFRLTQAVPPYLIALAVGDIAFRSVGPRTGVFSEPSVVEMAASEFAEMERMVEAAESILGPYAWGRYDVLVLPPSFPFGGMENPRLTFATPTVLAGDRSLVSLVAHELAHSWTGNLVTNATWNDFWLNEGFTSYVELRIMEAMYGAPRAAMLELLARTELQEEITRLGGSSAADTRLHLDLTGRNPDDGMTLIAYDKGAALLRLIEVTVGRDRFDAYLKGYLRRHAFQSITTAAFVDDIRRHLISGDTALEERLRLDDWIYAPGLPGNAVVPTSDALDRAQAQATAFAGGAAASSLMVKGWTTQEWQRFLNTLPASLSAANVAELDRAFMLSRQRNSEVLFSWLRVAMRVRHPAAMVSLERFLTEQGRRKFLRPLYEDLMTTEWGKAEAKRIYATARPLYHSVSVGTLDAIVK